MLSTIRRPLLQLPMVHSPRLHTARARWMTNFTIQQLSAFDSAGPLKNRDDHARAYHYAAIAYTMIGDMFNNFPIGSDRRDAAPPLGRGKMDSTYTVAITYTTAGLAIADSTKTKSLQLALTAQRARAEHAKAGWAKWHPAGPGVPNGGSGIVSDPAANADAAAALALATVDWKYRFAYSSTTIDNSLGAWVNSRQ